MGKRVNSTDKTKTRIFEIEEDIKKKKIRAGEIKKQMLSLKEKLSKLEQQISEQEQLIEQHKCELVSNSINEFGNISIDDILYALQNKDFLSLQEKIEAEAGAKEAEAGEKNERN